MPEDQMQEMDQDPAQMQQEFDEEQYQEGSPGEGEPEGYYVDEDGNPIDPRQYAYEQGEYEGESGRDQSEMDDGMSAREMTAADEKLLELEQWVQDVVASVQQSGNPYCDPEFPTDESSLYIDPIKPPEYAQETPMVEWKRPEEIWHGTEEKPLLMKDRMVPGDVK